MKRAAERRGAWPGWRPWWIAIARILREDRNSQESHSFDTTDEGIPGRAHGTFENLAPDKSRPEDAHSTESEIGLLYLATRTQAECADGLLPGAVVGTGDTLDQIGDRKKH